MSYTIAYGRLGNNIIRNLSLSIIAQKHNLKVDYVCNELIHKLGIKLFSGTNKYEKCGSLTESNYFTILNSDNLNYNLTPTQSMQTKEITDEIFKYLHNELKENIIINNEYKQRYNNNNDLFIHIRLTDVAKFNPGIEYYIKAINIINFDNLYISTDEITHDIIIKLKELYPSIQIINYDEINTFKFASTCKHIVLSHGSFSAIIGYLSFFSNVYYPNYEKKWYGDMFSGSIKNWIEIDKNL